MIFWGIPQTHGHFNMEAARINRDNMCSNKSTRENVQPELGELVGMVIHVFFPTNKSHSEKNLIGLY